MRQARVYTGFSTRDKVRAPYTKTDADLVKTDILNELLTRKGERVMRPSYGTTIHDMIMDPLDEYVVAEVEEEIKRVVSKDSRVSVGDIFITVLEHTIRADVQLTILPFLDEDSLFVEYYQEDLEV
jgi:phage baseplate assembly protein W